MQDGWFKQLNKMQIDDLPECATEVLTGVLSDGLLVRLSGNKTALMV